VSTGHPSLCCPPALLGARHPYHRSRDGTGSMAGHVTAVIGGVDTHKDTHVVAALSEQGALLGTAAFSTNSSGYAQLLDWLRGFGRVGVIGIEGTGSYGSGLCRFLQVAGIVVHEVPRPKRQWRRRYGKPCLPVKGWEPLSNVMARSRPSGCCAWFVDPR
jgi:Transposase